MNLGSFAGGAVQGYQNQERLQMAQAEQKSNLAFRERGMKMQEDEAAAKKAQRDREDAMRQANSEVFSKYYGEKEVPDGELGQDSGGAPRTKKVKISPGQDTKTDLAYLNDQMGVIANHGNIDPAIMMKMGEMARTHMDSARGRLLRSVVGGDESALAEMAKEGGKDPSKAKLIVDPAKRIAKIDWGDGTKPLDLRMAMLAVHAAGDLRQTENDVRDDAEKAATTAKVTAQGNLYDAQAKAFPAESAAKIRTSNASAAHSSAATGSLLDDKRQKTLDTRINSTIGKTPDATGDGKTEWMAPKQWVQSKVTGALSANPKSDMNKVFNEALTTFTKIKSATQSQFSSMVGDPTKLKALQSRYGTKDKATILQRMTEENLERN